MALNKYKLGELISLCTGGNEELQFGEDSVKGISINKEFISTKADLNGVSLANYTVVYPKCFSFVTVTSRNGNKISIAYNDSEESFIVSSFYVTFRLNDFGKSVLLEDYLYMFFNRSEFDRYARRDSWGSAREYFYFDNICDVDIELPSIPTQKKYVDIYKAMIANQQSYEHGLTDLKLVCDGYIENLRRNTPCEKIGPYITPCNERNENNAITLFQGVTVDHIFTDPKRVAEDAENGSVVRTGQFAFNKVMKAHNTKLPIALREGPDCVVSSSYQVFEVNNQEKILPKYLLLWMNRSETQRYAGFIAFGTTRDIFSFEDLGEISIPLPDIKVQQCIVDVFSAYQKRSDINERLKVQIKGICPILIKGAIEEGKKNDRL